MTVGESSSPAGVSQRLHIALRRGAFEKAADLYEKDAVFVELDGVSQRLAAIAAAHRRFVEAGLRVRLDDEVTFMAGDLALVHWSWVVESERGDATEGVSAEVPRRQADRSWRFVIDTSDGAAMLGR